MTGRPVLYLVVCAAPPALRIGDLVELLRTDGWTVCVIATPTAATWIDTEGLEARTGYPVRAQWRRPGESDVLPKADAVLVAPATFNTLNKWAVGINDNLALGILNEMLGSGLPILACPHAKSALTTHPAHATHVRLLTEAGVRMLPDNTLPVNDGPSRWAAVRDAVRANRTTHTIEPIPH
ncbi:flavoprotein [Micromonospora zhanjiangensis]|uniref:Flavoprotein n=1 Tax=Micromonospora zhanjiangensis TaxID=1522057 RepID=A0ABV8KTD7_9ACTN